VESIETYVRREYGDIADIFTNHQYPTYPEPKYTKQELSKAFDPFGLKREEIKRLMSLRIEKMERLESNKPRVFALIYGQLSLESQERLKDLPGWDAIERSHDPIELCKRIVATHLVNTRQLDIEETRYEARIQFNNCRQAWNESTAEFKKRYVYRIRALMAAGEHVLDESAQARDFLAKLDQSRYHELVKDYKNGLHQRATTLEEAYTLASNYVTTKRTQTGRPIFLAAARAAGGRGRGRGSGGRGGQRDAGRGRGGGRGAPHKKKGPSAEYPCAICGSAEHWANDCPNKTEEKDGSNATHSRVLLVTTVIPNDITDMNDDSIIPESQRVAVSATVLTAREYICNSDIVLDTGGSVSIFRDRKCAENVYESDSSIYITGISAEAAPLTTNLKASTVFGEVNFSTESMANVLSYSEVKDRSFKTWQDPRDDIFRVQMEEGGATYLFRRRAGIYVHNIYDRRDIISAMKGNFVGVTTVQNNILKYTKSEVNDAEKARELIRKLGYPSIPVAIRMISSGAILNCPITVKDIIRAQDIWGEDPAQLKGKTTMHKTPKVVLDQIIPVVRERQEGHFDLMFVDGVPYGVMVLVPIHMTFVSKLKSKNSEELYKCITKHIGNIRGKGFVIDTIRSDPEPALTASQEAFGHLGITLEIAGQQQAVPVVERMIRQIKERARGIANTLPFRAPKVLIPHLIQFCVGRINMVPTRNGIDNTTPLEKYSGYKIDYTRTLRASFGEYVQASRNVADNTLAPRTDGGIALYDTGNREGTWYIYNLNTDRVIRRNTFKVLPMPQIVIDHLNNLDNEQHERRELLGIESGDEDGYVEEDEVNSMEQYINDIADRYIMSGGGIRREDDDADVYDTESITTIGEQCETVQETDNKEEEPIDHSDVPHEDDSESEAETETDDEELETWDVELPPDLTEEEAKPAADIQQTTGRYDLRTKRAVAGRYSKREYGLHLTVSEAKRTLGESANEAIRAELQQMLNRQVWTPVSETELLREREKPKVISSSMFIKEKYKADGTFEKVKARLVAGGHLQDRSLYHGQTQSPTVNTSALFIVGTVAAHERRAIATIDFPGAYLNARMPNDQAPVYMRLDRALAEELVTLDNSYRNYLTDKKQIIVKLEKALYGCVQSARLWYNTLTENLSELGYTANRYDKCVWNKQNDQGEKCTICIHVDDIFMTASTDAYLETVVDELRGRFAELSVNRGNIHNYLGIIFDFSEIGVLKLNMDSYTEQLVSYSGVTGKPASSPATAKLFKIDVKSKLLSTEKQQIFHTCTAKALYLAKRARPDALLACAFLSTRVGKATEEDWEKLSRLLRYLKGTIKLGLRLQVDTTIGILSYIDASYATHEDYKSHTGIVVSLGAGAIFAKSSKQRLNTKSSTEAELVGVSDGMGHVVWIRNFMIEQGYNVEEATIFQDNTSTLHLIDSGNIGSDRTRHISIRYYFVTDRVGTKEVKFSYLKSEDMVADLLTKPLQGRQFRKLRRLMMNE